MVGHSKLRLIFFVYLKVLEVNHLPSLLGDFRCQVVEGQGGDAVRGQQRRTVLHQLPSTTPQI